MEIVINKCYGGFGLSNMAIARLAELNGKKAYFFEQKDLLKGEYTPVDIDSKAFIVSAFSIPNPNEYFGKRKEWQDQTMEEWRAENEKYSAVSLDSRPEDRADPLLIRVVKELGEKANGPHANLKIVEIPDGTDWELDEYDGIESVHEKHQSWD